MQIKVNYLSAVKGLERKSKNFLTQAEKKIMAAASIEMGKMKLPAVTGRLQNSYWQTGVKRIRKGLIRFGSMGGERGSNYSAVIYANWIETGRRMGRKGTVKRKTTKGQGAFKRAKDRIIRALPKAIKSVNINNL